MLGAFQTSLHLTHQPAPVGIISLHHCVLPAGRQTLVSQNSIHLITVKKGLLKSNLITLLLHLKPPGSPSHTLRMAPSAQAGSGTIFCHSLPLLRPFWSLYCSSILPGELSSPHLSHLGVFALGLPSAWNPPPDFRMVCT